MVFRISFACIARLRANLLSELSLQAYECERAGLVVNDSIGHPLPSTLAVLLDHAFKRNGVGLKYIFVSSIR